MDPPSIPRQVRSLIRSQLYGTDHHYFTLWLSLSYNQGYVRAINPRVQAQERWSWRMTSPALLAYAVREHGWLFIPNQVLPPLLANATVGAVLYTTYLQSLGLLHEPSSRSSKRVYPPPSFGTTFAAGFTAGSIQSLVAAPLDALQVRFQASDLLEGRYKNMWQYAHQKLQSIGVKGVMAGWSLSFVKDSLGYGAFFSCFEYIKSQCFYSFVSQYYGHFGKLSHSQQKEIAAQSTGHKQAAIKPHYMLEPTFILFAGIAASITQQAIQYPLTKIQEIHYQRLEYVDTHRHTREPASRRQVLNLYASAYRKTMKQCLVLARQAGGLRTWLYSGFLIGTLRQVPSTSAGLIVFEIVRRKYGIDEDAVRIEKDGYDIHLS